MLLAPALLMLDLRGGLFALVKTGAVNGGTWLHCSMTGWSLWHQTGVPLRRSSAMTVLMVIPRLAGSATLTFDQLDLMNNMQRQEFSWRSYL